MPTSIDKTDTEGKQYRHPEKTLLLLIWEGEQGRRFPLSRFCACCPIVHATRQYIYVTCSIYSLAENVVIKVIVTWHLSII